MITRPGELHGATDDAFSSGDLDRLCSLYEAGAVLITTDPGVEESRAEVGRFSIREQWSAFLETGGTLESLTRFVVERDDLALLSASWTCSWVARKSVGGSSAEVARRQRDRGWLYAVDSPFALGAT